MRGTARNAALYFNRRHGRTGHVFAQRYKAMLVDKDNYLLQVSRYIHLNAVEAKLAERPQDYRWSSYRSYLKGKGIADQRRSRYWTISPEARAVGLSSIGSLSRGSGRKGAEPGAGGEKADFYWR